MASAPPSSLSPSVFRSSTPSGCPHEKMAAEAPIELGEARPPVASREGGEQHLEGDYLICHILGFFCNFGKIKILAKSAQETKF